MCPVAILVASKTLIFIPPHRLLSILTMTRSDSNHPPPSGRTQTKSVTKRLANMAWRITIDSCVLIFVPRLVAIRHVSSAVSRPHDDCRHRTRAPLLYPPHTVALASIRLAALLLSFDAPHEPTEGHQQSAHVVAVLLSHKGVWEGRFQAHVEDLEGPCRFLPDGSELTNAAAFA